MAAIAEGSLVRLTFDASRYRALAEQFERLPIEIRRQAFSAAGTRVAQMARTRIVRDVARNIGVAQKHVRSRTTAAATGYGDVQLRIKSRFIPVIELGGRRVAKVLAHRPPKDSSYGRAFYATVSTGHAGIFSRTTAARIPVRELYGPNPAHAVIAKEDVYRRILVDIAEEYLWPRIEHEIAYRIGLVI